MTRTHLALILLFLAAPARADKPELKPAPRPLLETWQAAYFEGLKVGHVHTLARRVGDGEDARIHTTRTMHLLIKRYGSVLPIRIEQSSVETSDGKVLTLGLSQQLGKSPKVIYSGQVEGGSLL